MTSTSIPTFPFDRPVPTEPSPMLSELRNSCPVAPIELPRGTQHGSSLALTM